MEEKVIELGDRLRISVDVSRNHSPENDKTEADFRNKRLSAYQRLQSDVVVCHHLNDCEESHCMRAFCGHEEYQPIPPLMVMDNGYQIIRPFMLNTKNDFKKQIKHEKLQDYVVEDMTNHNPDYCRRTWVRNELIPLFKSKGISIEGMVRKKVLECYENIKEKNNF